VLKYSIKAMVIIFKIIFNKVIRQGMLINVKYNKKEYTIKI